MKRITQNQRLRELFEGNPNVWISLPVILDMKIAQYNARLFELKRGAGGRKIMDIQNRTQSVKGEKWSWFMFVPSVDVQSSFV